MKTLKASILFCLVLLSQVVFAGEWTHVNLEKDGIYARVSYTTSWHPATIGSHGGNGSTKIYVDVYSKSAMKAETVELFGKTSPLKEDTSTHSWVQITGQSYGDVLWIGECYVLKLVVNGQIVEFKFKAI